MPDEVRDLPQWRWLRLVGELGDDFWADDLGQLHVSERAKQLLEGYAVGGCEFVPT